MTIAAEVKTMKGFRENSGNEGEVSLWIRLFKPGNLIFDVYSQDLFLAGIDESEWDVDEQAEKMIVLKFHDKRSFKKVFGLARMMRAKVRQIS
ncbi:hypothetical protein [Raoultella sp. C349492]|uniref:hypothetical protein n=1 Tax=Raoultella sp. C349492 TaxID=2970253 RepID=UPI0035C74040